MAASSETEEWLRKKDLYAVLQGYASTLEVQYMIDQSIDKFATKKLTAAVEACVAAQLHQSGAAELAAPSQPAASTSAPSAEWMETLVRAKLEADLEQRLPALIAAEVQRQRQAHQAQQAQQAQEATRPTGEDTDGRRGRARADRADSPSSSPPQRRLAASSSPPPAERPPLPPGASPPRKVATDATKAAEDEDEDEDAGPHLGLQAACEATATTAATAAPVAIDASRQRARILEAIQDVEHQVNTLQRQVNELSHQGRARHQRVGRFWSALAPPVWSSRAGPAVGHEDVQTPPTSSSRPTTPRPAELSASAAAYSTASANYGAFYAALMAALDADETAHVRALVTEAMTAVHGAAGLPTPSTTAAAVAAATDLSPRSPSALRQSPIVATLPSVSLNDSVDSARTVSPGTRQAVLPLHTRHAPPPRRAEPLPPPFSPATSASSAVSVAAAASMGMALQLGVDAVDVPGGLLPSSLGLRGGGVRVLSVAAGQVAERSGLLTGDVVLQIRQTPIETCAQLRTALRGVMAHDVVPVEVYRHSAQVLLTILLLF